MVNFNSHAHVERDKNGIKNKAMELISTHTLTWSVTHLKFKRKILYIISTHTLTWSVTLISLSSRSALTISTHTLTWSVTMFSATRARTTAFQLTRSRGA